MFIHTVDGLTARFNGECLTIATGQDLIPITKAQLNKEQQKHNTYCSLKSLHPGTLGYQSIDAVKPSPPPKHLQKRVVWNSSGDGQAILLVGYCDDTLENFLGLAEELKKCIPQANIAKAVCGKVSSSAIIKGFTLFMAPIPGPKREIKGFEEYDRIDFGY